MLSEAAANEHKSYRIKTPSQFNSLSRSQAALHIRISILRGLGYSFSLALSFIKSPALKIHPSNITNFGRLIFQLPDHFHCSPNAAPSHQELQLKPPPAPPRGKHARDNWHRGDPWSHQTSMAQAVQMSWAPQGAWCVCVRCEGLHSNEPFVDDGDWF